MGLVLRGGAGRVLRGVVYGGNAPVDVCDRFGRYRDV